MHLAKFGLLPGFIQTPYVFSLGGIVRIGEYAGGLGARAPGQGSGDNEEVLQKVNETKCQTL